jgi:predicted LPLAT superfamily acyltransferase
MGAFFYGLTIRLSRVFGYWPIRGFAWCVATAYFVLFPDRVRNSARFFHALLPERSHWQCLRLAWRQFHQFTTVYVDRLKAINGEAPEYREEGGELLRDAVAQNAGGVIVSSHLGNWELAAILLMKKYGPRLLLYVGEKERQELERRHKTDLLEKGIRIVSVAAESATPFDLLDAVSFIRGGGFVSIAGDRVWSPKQQLTDVEFLGRQARVPAAPFVLALLCGAPMFTFFMTLNDDGSYVLSFSRLEAIAAPSRAERDQALRRMAQNYANALAAKAREHPTNWHHFEPFLGPPRT